MKYIGIDIGGTKCAVTSGDAGGRVLEKIFFATTGVEETLHNIFEAVGSLGECDAIGISCGGPLDGERGIILSPPNLPGWDKIRITDMLKERFKVPAFLQNDADACALAEWKKEAEKGADNMIFLTFGTGLGAGLILNRELYTGTCNMAGEIGHVRMAETGPVGYGKAGSLEGFCSGGGIAQMGQAAARESFQRGQSASFCKTPEEFGKITAKRIAECAYAGYEDAAEIYRRCGRVLGRGLAVMIDLLNPDKIVIGGIYARSGSLMEEEMVRVLKQECLPQSLEKCQILPAGLGESLGDIAALSVAVDGIHRLARGNNPLFSEFVVSGINMEI